MRILLIVPCLFLIAAGLSAQVGSWSAPAVVPELSSNTSDYYPFMSRDNLTFRVASSRTDIPGSPGGWDIYRAVRTNPHTPFGAISREPGSINGPTNDLGHHIMGDELTAYVANSMGGGVGGHDIWVFTRTSPTANWGTGVNLKPVNSTSTDYCVTVTDDHLEMYLSSSSMLKRSTRTGISSPWGTAAAVPELNAPTAPKNCMMPSITGDGLTMYLCMSGAPGGPGSYDIYVVTRKKRGDTWSAPTLVANINSSTTDHRPTISPDGRQLFFSSSRATGNPNLGSTCIWQTNFTGLSYQNLPQVASPLLLHITVPQKQGSSYQVGISFTNNTGIPVGSVGTIPLDLDPLLILSVQNILPTIFSNFGGTLNIYGEATATLHIPASLALVGIDFHAAAVTYGASGIDFITNGLVFSIHR